MFNQEQLTSKTTVAPLELESFISKRGCLPNLKQGLQITPAPRGSGQTDVSIDHDSILASCCCNELDRSSLGIADNEAVSGACMVATA